MIRVSFWTAVFLIILRLVIGWHFAYEGYGKVKSAYLGKATANEKPFSSETYFRESEGPFGKLVKSRIGDPDQEVVDKLTLKPVDGDVSNADPKLRFPAALEKDWDDYFNRFATQFKLNDEQKAMAQSKVDQAKANFVKWVGKVRTAKEKLEEQEQQLLPHDKEPPKPQWGILKVKRKAPGPSNTSADFEEEMTVAERAAELKKTSDAVKATYAKMYEMGKDVAGTNLRAEKSDVATIRTELQKEIDDKTKEMKDSLARILDTRVTAYAAQADKKDVENMLGLLAGGLATAYAAQADNKDVATKLQAMLTPMTGQKQTNPLGKMWDEYAEYVKDFAPNMNDGKRAEIDRALADAKARFDRWLADQDMYTGEPLATKEVADWRTHLAAAQARAAAPGTKADADAEIKTLTSQMQVELKAQSDAVRAQIGTPLLGPDRAKGYVSDKAEGRTLWVIPKSWTLIDFIDWSTRWFLLVVGCLLMVGLFSRLSCFAAAGFLLLTVLTQPSLPWIPAPPNSEGNYLVVNKNVIEMVALLVLMTTRSGRWFGLDAIVSWMFGSRRQREF